MVEDGNGVEIPIMALAEIDLDEYVEFKKAAKEICDTWTRHNIHKAVQLGQVDKSKILVVIDDKLYEKNWLNKGRKKFLHKSEIEKLREHYEQRNIGQPRRVAKCRWCKRAGYACERKPCEDRLISRLSPEERANHERLKSDERTADEQRIAFWTRNAETVGDRQKTHLLKRQSAEFEGTAEELRQTILSDVARTFTNEEITDRVVEEIGMALLENFGSVELAAEALNTTTRRVKYYLDNSLEVQEYALLGHECIKDLTDRKIIEALKNNEAWAKMWLANKLYSGRKNGAYNPAEIGLSGYKDKRTKRIVEETANDVKGQAGVSVTFNFTQKKVEFMKPQSETGDYEGDKEAIDADFEVVEETT